MYPATIVAIKSIATLIDVPETVATKIPSENGKFIGLASKKGLRNAKTSIDPTIAPIRA
jgi:hypothetical protein